MSSTDNEAKDTSKKHSCPYCGLSMRFKWSLTLHLRLHENNRPYECSICNRSFFSSTALKRHQDSHGEPRYACDKCPKRYRIDSSLRIHKKLHHGEGYKCRICSETFDSASEYQLHRRSHKEKSGLECSFCFKTFSSEKFKKEHEKGHKVPVERIRNPHRQRQKAFPQHEAIRNSPGTFSPNGNILVFENKCNLCGCLVSSKGDVENHFFSDHISIDENQYKCAHCPFKTTLISKLKGKEKTSIYQHLTRHSKVKPYKCEKCDYRSVRGSDILSHINYVHGESKHACKVCGKKFSNIKSLTQHSKTHGDPDKKFKCDQCGKSFWYLGKLKVHEEIHLQNKYLCHFCNKSFLTYHSLATHKIQHYSTSSNRIMVNATKQLSDNCDESTCLIYECFACGHISATMEGALCCEPFGKMFI